MKSPLTSCGDPSIRVDPKPLYSRALHPPVRWEDCLAPCRFRAGESRQGMPCPPGKGTACRKSAKLTVAPLLFIGFDLVWGGGFLIRRPLWNLPRGAHDRGV